MSKASKGEDIILQLSNIKYKKINGSLYLSSKRIGWMMENQDSFDVNILYTDIKNQKTSPEGKPKVQLQLVLHEQTYTFHFVNPESREKQVEERDNVKEKLYQLKSQNKRKPHDELLEKKRILEENPHLKDLYVSLVPTDIISSDDFWKEIAGKYKQTLGPSLDVGVSGAFLADIKPQTDGSNGRVLYNLTPEVMASIFQTYPSVKKKHEEYVPHQMTESEFWTRFFQSHYYSIYTTSRSDNVFSECAKYDEKEWMRELNTIKNDPMCDLTDIYEDKPLELSEFINVGGSKAGSNHIHATMIKRFNQHSLNILKSQTTSEREKMTDEMIAKNPDALVNGESVPELNLHKNKKARLAEKVQYDDLEDINKEYRRPLVIHQKSRYLAGPSADMYFHDEVSMEELPVFQHSLNNELRGTKCHLQHCQLSNEAIVGLQDHSQLLRKGKISNATHSVTTIPIPKDLQIELSKIYSSSSELFRHFWACFPPRTPQLQDKLHKMHVTLCKYRESSIRKFQDLAVRDYNCRNEVLDHLEEMFQIANSKFENWKARNGR